LVAPGHVLVHGAVTGIDGLVAAPCFQPKPSSQALNQLTPAATNLDGNAEGAMADVLQWLGVAFSLSVIALGLIGFFRGLSLPPNSPENRANGKGEYWRT
jgi:hypothetical protein